MVVHTYNPRTWRWRQKDHGFETSKLQIKTTTSHTVMVKTDWLFSPGGEGRVGAWGKDSCFLLRLLTEQPQGRRVTAWEEPATQMVVSLTGHPAVCKALLQGSLHVCTQPDFAVEGLESGKGNHLCAAEPGGYPVWLWVDLEPPAWIWGPHFGGWGC